MAVKVTVYGTADMRQIENARAELDKLEAAARQSQSGLSGAMTRMGASLESVGEKMTAVGGSMTRNVTVPLAALGAGLAIATNAAAEDAQAQANLANTLRNTAGATDASIASTESWITAQGKALGVADDKLRPALGVLAGATGDVAKAQELAALAMDISAARGIDLESAANGLAKAYAGNLGALKRLVPGIDEAAIASGDFSQVQAALAGMVGGAASTAADTQAGAMQRAKIAISEAGEAVGTAFLPVMQTLADIVITRIAPAIEKFAGWLSQIPTPVIMAAVAIGGLLAAAGPLLIALGSMTSGVGALMTILPKLGGAMGGVLGPVGLVLGVLAAIVASSPQLQAMLMQLVNQLGMILMPVFQQLWAAIQPVLQQLGQTFTQIIAALVPVLGQLISALAPVIVTIGTVLAGVLQAIVDSGILDMLASLFTQIVTALLPLIPLVGELVMAFIPLIEPIMELISTLIPPLVQLLSAVLPIAIAVVVTAIKVVVAILQVLIGVIIEVVKAVVSFAADFIKNVTKLAQDVGRGIGEVIDWFAALPGRIGDTLSGAARWLVNVGRDIVDGLWNGIKGGWDWLTDMIGGLVDDLIGGVKDLLGIKSPSRVFAEIGSQMGAGLRVGLEAAQTSVVNAATGLAAAATVTAAVTTGVTGSVSGGFTAAPASYAAAPAGKSITVASGAVQITVSGGDVDGTRAVVEEAFADLVRELRAL